MSTLKGKGNHNHHIKGKHNISSIILNNKKKQKRLNQQTRCSIPLGNVVSHQTLSGRPAWDSNTHDNPYSLNSTEIENRRRDRISKNLAKAQYELYEKMFRRCLNKNPSNNTSLQGGGGGKEVTANYERLKDNPYVFLDLDELLQRSEEILNESRELLNTNHSERMVSKINFTGK